MAEGRPADAILETAVRENVKLIVMGVQTRGALDRLLFGSTTRRVMQAATCPVLSIRGGQAAGPGRRAGFDAGGIRGDNNVNRRSRCSRQEGAGDNNSPAPHPSERNAPFQMASTADRTWLEPP